MEQQILTKILQFLKTNIPTSFTEEEKEYIAEIVLNYIYSKRTTEEQLKDGDFQSPSLLQIINNFSDMQDIDFNNHENYNFWNESLKVLFNHGFFKNYDQTGKFIDEAEIFSREDGKKYKLKEIINSDAGYDFSNKYVKPELNWNIKKYKDVRGNADFFKTAAQSGLNLQRTSIQDEIVRKWISLLMPCNTRRVEVEDLNRNFWVIGQTTSLLCSYIFDEREDSFLDLLKKIMSEVSQLWENMLFLWVIFELISKQKVEGLVTQIIPLPASEFDLGRKYDRDDNNFKNIYSLNNESKVNIIQRLSYLKDLYKDSNLCFLIYLLDDNYYQNYYSNFIPLGVYFYNRTTKNENFAFIVSQKDQNKHVNVDMKNLDNNDKYLYAIKEGDINYTIAYPFSELENVLTETPQTLYSFLRIRPAFEASLENNQIIINNISFDFYDAARYTYLKGDIDPFAQLSLIPDNNFNEGSNKIILKKEYLNKKQEEKFLPKTIYGRNGYYTGEIISWRKTTREKPEDLIYHFGDLISYSTEGILIKIGNFLPSETDNNTIYYQLSMDGTLTSYALNMNLRTTKNQGKTTYYNTSNSCYFTPKITDNSHSTEIGITSQWTYNYSIKMNEVDSDETTMGLKLNAEKVTKSFIRKNALEVIKTFLEKDLECQQHNIGELISNNKIIHLYSTIGLQPWQGSSYNQGYWSQNLITNLLVYLPKEFVNEQMFNGKKQKEDWDIIYRTNEIIPDGYIFILNDIDFKEDNYSGGLYEYVAGSRWRLPKLYSSVAQSSLLTYTLNDYPDQYYAVLNEKYYQMYVRNPESIIVYIQNGDIPVYNDLDIAKKKMGEEIINNPSGTWCVFDGNTTKDKTNSSASPWENIHNFNPNNAYRQFIEMYFYYDDNEIKAYNILSRERREIRNNVERPLNYLSWNIETDESHISTWRSNTGSARIKSFYDENSKYHEVTKLTTELTEPIDDVNKVFKSSSGNWTDNHVTW